MSEVATCSRVSDLAQHVRSVARRFLKDGEHVFFVYSEDFCYRPEYRDGFGRGALSEGTFQM
jgi:hypothetical protein